MSDLTLFLAFALAQLILTALVALPLGLSALRTIRALTSALEAVKNPEAPLARAQAEAMLQATGNGTDVQGVQRDPWELTLEEELGLG